MRHVMLALALTAWCPRAIQAQETAQSIPKIEVLVAYPGVVTEYFFIDAGPSLAARTNLDSRRGVETAVIRNVNGYLGIKGDFSAHFGHYRDTDEIPCVRPCATATQEVATHSKLFDFLVGPEIKARNHTRATPFAHALFGVAHSTATLDTAGKALNLSRTVTHTGFAMAFGGGADVRIARGVSARVSVDYGSVSGGREADGTPERMASVRVSTGLLFRVP